MAKDKLTIPMDKEDTSGGGRPHLPEGDYIGKIVKVTSGASEDKGTPFIGITIKITEGKYSGKKITDRLWLSPKALPRVRQLLELCGIEVPKKRFSVDKGALKGKEIGFSLEDDKYTDKNDKERVSSRVGWEFLEADFVRDGGEVDDDEDEDDEDEDTDDDDDDEDDDEEVDLEDDDDL